MFTMPGESTTFRRARSAAQKQQRREAILAAARGLGAQRGVRCMTLGDIAGEVGLAKSNVLRYFGTREEILLQLTVDGWRDWTEAVRGRLDTSEQDPQQVAEVLADTISQLPLFCDLLAHTAAHLEHNVSLAAVRSIWPRSCALRCPSSASGADPTWFSSRRCSRAPCGRSRTPATRSPRSTSRTPSSYRLTSSSCRR